MDPILLEYFKRCDAAETSGSFEHWCRKVQERAAELGMSEDEAVELYGTVPLNIP
jgi:hypothetical protein